MRRKSLARFLVPLAVGGAVSFFGFIPLMGLPGAVVSSLTALLFGFSNTLSAYGPSVWGLAIYVTWLAGAGVPIGCWLLWALRPKAGVAAWIAAGLAGFLVVGAISTVVIVRSSPPQPHTPL